MLSRKPKKPAPAPARKALPAPLRKPAPVSPALSLAEAWNRNHRAPCRWIDLGHHHQLFVSLGYCGYSEHVLYPNSGSGHFKYHLDQLVGLTGWPREHLLLDVHLFLCSVPHSAYWTFHPATSLTYSDKKDWLSDRSPYVLLPAFSPPQRIFLITHTVLCLSYYTRLQKALIMEKTAVPVDVRAARITLSHVLNMLEGMFRARGTLRESAYEKALDSAKKVLRKVQAEPQAK